MTREERENLAEEMCALIDALKDVIGKLKVAEYKAISVCDRIPCLEDEDQTTCRETADRVWTVLYSDRRSYQFYMEELERKVKSLARKKKNKKSEAES